MPIYEYRCPNGHTFEVFQRITDPAVGSCEICGAELRSPTQFGIPIRKASK